MIKKYRFPFLIILAFAIRLVLMPISAHSDLLAINAFPDLIYTEGVVDILSYSKENVQRAGFSYYPPLTYFTFGLFQYAFHLVSGTFSPWMTGLREGFISGLPGQAPDFLIKYPNDFIFRDLFLSKLPYLFFDIACILLLYKFAKDKYLNKQIIILWLFNPIFLYDAYIFGQFDVIPAFFVLLGFLLLKRKPSLGILSMGIAMAYKNYALLFIPLFVLIFGDTWKERVKLLLIALFPSVVFVVPTLINNPGEAVYALFNKVIFSSKKPLEGWPLYSAIIKYSILFATYSPVVMSAQILKIRNKWTLALGLSYISILLLITLTPRTSFHYLFWLTPLTILWFRDTKTSTVIILAQTISFASYKILANHLQLGLFAPLDPRFFSSLPTFNSLISTLVPYRIISATGFFTFSLFNIWIIFRVAARLIFEEEVKRSKRN